MTSHNFILYCLIHIKCCKKFPLLRLNFLEIKFNDLHMYMYDFYIQMIKYVHSRSYSLTRKSYILEILDMIFLNDKIWHDCKSPGEQFKFLRSSCWYMVHAANYLSSLVFEYQSNLSGYKAMALCFRRLQSMMRILRQYSVSFASQTIYLTNPSFYLL